MTLGCFFTVREANIPKMLPPPSACWFIRFSELQKGQMIQRLGWRGDPGQETLARAGWWGWTDFLFPDRGGCVWACSCPVEGGLCTWGR